MLFHNVHNTTGNYGRGKFCISIANGFRGKNVWQIANNHEICERVICHWGIYVLTEIEKASDNYAFSKNYSLLPFSFSYSPSSIFLSFSFSFSPSPAEGGGGWVQDHVGCPREGGCRGRIQSQILVCVVYTVYTVSSLFYIHSETLSFSLHRHYPLSSFYLYQIRQRLRY